MSLIWLIVKTKGMETLVIFHSKHLLKRRLGKSQFWAQTRTRTVTKTKSPQYNVSVQVEKNVLFYFRPEKAFVAQSEVGGVPGATASSWLSEVKGGTDTRFKSRNMLRPREGKALQHHHSPNFHPQLLVPKPSAARYAAYQDKHAVPRQHYQGRGKGK